MDEQLEQGTELQRETESPEYRPEQASGQDHRHGPEEKPGQKQAGFRKGVWTGTLATLAAVAIIGGMALGVRQVIRGVSGSSQTAGSTGTNTTAESGSSTEWVLDSDTIEEVSVLNSYLNDYYLHDFDAEDLKTGMLKGMIEALDDPYSVYYDEDELASFNDSIEGSYVGIGAAVTQNLETGVVKISKPYEGTPSAEAGLLPGDTLVSVDGTEVTGMELTRVVSLIKGEEGTTVSLHIYRESEGKYLDIDITRATIEIPTVTYEMLDDQIGYIVVTEFGSVTTNQFIAAYEDLENQGMKQLIIDLRDDGGGLVDTVTSMLDYLLPEGVIFYAKDKNGNKSMEYTSDADAALDVPLAVLVNGNTASASEIFAGNIQEFGVGTIVGTTTYGKGVMQQMYYTNSEKTEAVKLTVADYYYHNDKNINGVGVIPDQEVELDEAVSTLVSIPKDQDNQLKAAIEAVKAK